MKTLILAAGYAVRLKPLTLNTPKPLLEIGGVKIIDRILDKLSEAGAAEEIFIITNDKFFGKFEGWAASCPRREKVSLINDGSDTNETRLGAIKDIEIAIERGKVDGDLLVIAGDNLFELKVKDFLSFAKKRSDGVTVALYDIGDLNSAKRFGVVRLDAADRIIDFEEKPQSPKSTLISTGIYYFPKEKVPYLRKYIDTQAGKTDAPGNYISWLSRTDKVYGFTFSEDWWDIGDLESYKKADGSYSQKEKKEKRGDG
jgi:glucose-1-phosphate thymidylyltransferase